MGTNALGLYVRDTGFKHSFRYDEFSSVGNRKQKTVFLGLKQFHGKS